MGGIASAKVLRQGGAVVCWRGSKANGARVWWQEVEVHITHGWDARKRSLAFLLRVLESLECLKAGE